MAQEPRPAPVLTIVDPSCPGTLVDVVEGHEPREPFRPSLVQLIAGALALLLTVSLGAVADQRGELAQVDRRLIGALSMVGFHNGLAGAIEAPTSLDYLFVLVAPEPSLLDVRSVSVMGAGWRARTGVTHPVFPPGRDVLALSHDVDCGRPILARPEAVVTVAAGRHRRAVTLDLDPQFLSAVRQSQRAACGDVDAGEALQVVAGSARRSGDRLLVDLGLTNTSIYPVQVTGLSIEGLSVVASPAAPLVLAGREAGPVVSSGVRRLGELPGRPIRLEMILLECLGVGQVHAGAARGEAATVLVRVDGRGGAGTREVAVDGLTQLRAELTQQRCAANQR